MNTEFQAFSGAPHRGETPITFASGVAPGSVHVDVEVPADAFSDITAAAIRGGADLKDAFDKVE